MFVTNEPSILSDSAITEDIAPEENADDKGTGETDGNAQSSVGTTGIAEDVEPETVRSASADDDTVQEDPPDDSVHDSTNSDSTKSVQLRRSTRERRPLLRYRSDEYDMSRAIQRVSSSDWERKINILTSLSDKRIIQGLQSEAGENILEILKSKQNDRTSFVNRGGGDVEE